MQWPCVVRRPGTSPWRCDDLVPPPSNQLIPVVAGGNPEQFVIHGLQPFVIPIAGGNPVAGSPEKARLRNEISELPHTLAETRHDAQRQAEQREQGFRRHAVEYEMAARDICASELATHDATLRSDFNPHHNTTISQAEACIANVRSQGQEHAEHEAQQAKRQTIEEAEEAFKVKQATMQIEMNHAKQQHDLIVASLSQRLATAKGNLEREQANSQTMSHQIAAFNNEKSDLRHELERVSATLHQQEMTFETTLEQMRNAHHQELSAAKGNLEHDNQQLRGLQAQHSCEADLRVLQYQQEYEIEKAEAEGNLERQFATEKLQVEQATSMLKSASSNTTHNVRVTLEARLSEPSRGGILGTKRSCSIPDSPEKKELHRVIAGLPKTNGEFEVGNQRLVGEKSSLLQYLGNIHNHCNFDEFDNGKEYRYSPDIKDEIIPDAEGNFVPQGTVTLVPIEHGEYTYNANQTDSRAKESDAIEFKSWPTVPCYKQWWRDLTELVASSSTTPIWHIPGSQRWRNLKTMKKSSYKSAMLP